jgi:hypothetical protein
VTNASHRQSIFVLFSLVFLVPGCATDSRPAPTGEVQTNTNSFSFELSDPRVRISVPELPAIQMGPHPLAKAKPHLRVMGSAPPYNLSILTPTADAGMTAEKCANSAANWAIKQYGLSKGSYRLLNPKGSDTYSMYFPLRLAPGKVQLHAYLFTAYAGSHCIEVHVTKFPASESEIGDWLKGFPGARIETKL